MDLQKAEAQVRNAVEQYFAVVQRELGQARVDARFKARMLAAMSQADEGDEEAEGTEGTEGVEQPEGTESEDLTNLNNGDGDDNGTFHEETEAPHPGPNEAAAAFAERMATDPTEGAGQS